MPTIRSSLASAFVALVLVVAPPLCAAQVQTGSILIRTADEQGGAMPSPSRSAAPPVVPQFLSPAQVYGPRNIRFNVAFRV